MRRRLDAVRARAMHRHWMFRVAATTAIERVANFLCEIDLRLMAIGQSDGHRFALHLTQAEMGEICGVTSIHVNRVLRELREHGTTVDRVLSALPATEGSADA